MVSSTRSLKRMSHLKGEAVLSRHRYTPSTDPWIGVAESKFEEYTRLFHSRLKS